MARSARLRKTETPASARPAAKVARRTSYHGDTAGHQKILEALGGVPELNEALPNLDGATAADQREDRWPAIKTFFFVIVFCSTAWATISTAILIAFR